MSIITKEIAIKKQQYLYHKLTLSHTPIKRLGNETHNCENGLLHTSQCNDKKNNIFCFSTFLNLNVKKIDRNNRILSSLRLQSVKEVGDKSMEEKDPISYDHGSASSGDVKKVIVLYNQEDKHGDGNTYVNLGNAYDNVGDLKIKTQLDYHITSIL